jgi:hemerythrin-like domain-containing protein
MKATQVLMDEHRVIERVLNAVEEAANRLERGTKIDASFFLDATEFIRGFADGCHHQKEEGVLFKAMTAAGMPRGQGPIAVMLSEHEQARTYTRNLLEAAERLQGGNEQAAREVVGYARGYVALLRQHIAKEDNVLFPMAEQAIPVAQHANVEAEFERVEEDEAGQGVHEQYLALAKKLEDQLASM